MNKNFTVYTLDGISYLCPKDIPLVFSKGLKQILLEIRNGNEAQAHRRLAIKRKKRSKRSM